MEWEYKHLAARSLSGIARQLTKLSREGWEIVHINYNLFAMWDGWEVLLKRRVAIGESK